MPTSVRLDAKTEILVTRLARKTGRTKSQVIRDAIARLAEDGDGAEKRAKTPYEAMKHLIGIADSGGANLSERTGEKFTARLREQARARRSR
ncbi:MAG: CopG family transcriptional regulator [Candidatus Rokubacteria bacterium]|nr:CopG family transcriptional regulator [Candidatus Rokubacteria bacterium]